MPGHARRLPYEGLIPKFKRLYLSKDAEQLPAILEPIFDRIVTRPVCEQCKGARLSAAALGCRRHLGSSPTELVYILDEPSVGLHPHDIQRLTQVLQQLRGSGNTVLVVEHKPAVIAIADRVVDMGPGAGRDGGRVVLEGTPRGSRPSTPRSRACTWPGALRRAPLAA